MEFGEFRRKIAYLFGRSCQFDLTKEEETKLKDLYDEIYALGDDRGYDRGWEDGINSADDYR